MAALLGIRHKLLREGDFEANVEIASGLSTGHVTDRIVVVTDKTFALDAFDTARRRDLIEWKQEGPSIQGLHLHWAALDGLIQGHLVSVNQIVALRPLEKTGV